MPDPRVDVPLRTTCPRCKAPLLALPFDGGTKLHPCGTCRGVFVPALAWCSLIERPQIAHALEKRIPRAKHAASALVTLVQCASCGSEMERGRFGASSPIVVDVCARHGIWLDAGELGEVAQFIATRARNEVPIDVVPPSAQAFQHVARHVKAPPSRGARILKSVLVAVVLGVLGRVALYYYWKSHGGPDIEQHGEDSARAAEEARRALQR